MENGELKINSLPPSGYSLYKQRESWYLFPKTKTIPAPPLIIEEVAAKLKEHYYLKILNLKFLESLNSN